MYEKFRNRMEHQGSYMGEILRHESEAVVNATWMNSVSVRPVCVKVVDTGLPPDYHCVEDYDELLWAHVEPHNKFNVTKDEQDFYLTFKPHDIYNHPEIQIGAYVCIPNVDNEFEWWLILYIDDDNELRKCQILKCNWIFKWITEGKIYNCLGCQRVANSYNSGSWDGDRFGFVDNIVSAWLPTNSDTVTIGYNHRMLISDERRFPPLAWTISKIEDTVPVGVTKFRFTQETYDPIHDNAELMLANYYDDEITPIPVEQSMSGSVTITYSGSKPTIKVGGSFKVFTATFDTDGTVPQSWFVSDGINTFSSTVEDYIIEYENNQLKLKVAQKYSIIGTVLTVKVIGSNGVVGEIQVEVVG